jgi:hypothetical protein
MVFLLATKIKRVYEKMPGKLSGIIFFINEIMIIDSMFSLMLFRFKGIVECYQ